MIKKSYKIDVASVSILRVTIKKTALTFAIPRYWISMPVWTKNTHL
ncbi:hypothetical protein UNH65_28280 [Chitinophaga sp. 180180018-2]|nr:hypothetical protein [Chitinophaga sp. 212800010-3]